MSKIITPVELPENTDVSSIICQLAKEVGWEEVLLLASEEAASAGLSFTRICGSTGTGLDVFTNRGWQDA